jgi:histone H3/H4
MAVELTQEQSDAADADFSPKKKSKRKSGGVTQEPLCIPLSTFRRYLKTKYPNKAHLKISKTALNLMNRLYQQRTMHLLTQALSLQKHTKKETLQSYHVVKAYQLISSQGSSPSAQALAHSSVDNTSSITAAKSLSAPEISA